ncbi:MAG: hypothetical protein LBT40_05705 [Deltaproteobacteria bacterium]|jgi:hypothetical protein|nr:hypothetical protein [Deltaproteobacteria bacterium]
MAKGERKDYRGNKKIDHPRTAKLTDYFFRAVVKKARDLSRIAWDLEECAPEDINPEFHALVSLLDAMDDFRNDYAFQVGTWWHYLKDCKEIDDLVFADALDDMVKGVRETARLWRKGRSVSARLIKARIMRITGKEMKALADERLSEKFSGARPEKYLVFLKK